MAEEQKNTEETKEKKEHQEKKKKRFGTGAIVSIFSVSVVGLVGVGYFYTLPHYEHVEANKVTISDRNNEITNKQAKLEELKKRNEKIAQMTEEELKNHLTDDEKKLREKLPMSIDIPDLIRDVDDYSKIGTDDDEVFLQSFSLGRITPDKDHGVLVLPISLQISSSKFGFMEYLKGLENTEHRIINVKSISLNYTDRKFDEILPLFSSDAKNKEYYNLLKKRQYFLLDDDEAKRLKEIQKDVFKEYDKRRKDVTDEEKLSELALLTDEIATIKKESTYSIDLETYFYMSPEALEETNTK